MFQSKDGLVDEHAQAIQRPVAPQPGLGQELRFSRVINKVAHRRRMRKGVLKVKILELARHSPHAQGGAVHQQIGPRGLQPQRCSVKADGAHDGCIELT